MRPNLIPIVILALLPAVSVAAGSGGEDPDTAASAGSFAEEIAFIENLRGIEFSGEIDHRSIPRSELKEYLRGTWTRDLPIPEADYFDALVALHLIDANAEAPLESLLDLYVSQVLAFYDPIENVFYTVEDAPESPLGAMTAAFERAVTIHELVHVLQDEQFGAGATLEHLIDDWDGSLAYHALIEGEATLVMLAVLIEDLGGSLDEALMDDQIIRALGEAANVSLPSEGTPPYFIESMKFPYVDGLAYVIDLYRDGGWDAITARHADPPESSEMIYDREEPGRIAALEVEDALIETTLGEFHWRFLLGKDVADPWETDRVAVVPTAGGHAVLAVTEWSSDESGARFAEAYVDFLEKRGSRPIVSREGPRVTVVYGAEPIPDSVMSWVRVRDERRAEERSIPR